MSLKRFLCSLLVFSVFFAYTSISLAEEAEEGQLPAETGGSGTVVATAAPVSIPQPFQIEVTLIDDSPAPDVSAESAGAAQDVFDVLDVVDVSAQNGVVGGSVVALDPPASERDGLPGVIEEVFGTYTPRTYSTITYIDGELVYGSELVPGLAGLDWPWLVGVGLFSLMLFCLFKLLGGLWK